MHKLIDFLFTNQTTRQTIAKNTFWQFIGQVGSRAIRAILVIYAARTLGAEGYGVFSYAIGFMGLFTIFLDAGLDTILTRELAKKGEEKEKIIAAAVYLKSVLILITYCAIVIVATRITPIAASRSLFPFIGLALIFDAVRQFGFSVTKAFENMQVEAGVITTSHVGTVLFGIIALVYWKTPFALSVAYALGSFLGAAMILYYLRDLFHSLGAKFDMSVIKNLLKDSWSFGLLATVGTLLINMDTTILGWLSTSEQVGFYNAAQKPVQLLFVLPVLLATVTFPALSRRSVKNATRSITEKSLAMVNLISFPVAMGSFLLPEFIINFLYGAEYYSAVVPFRILILVVLLNYPATIFGFSILAHNKQLRTVPYFLVAIAVNALLDYTFIPRFGITGAAYATLISQLITTFGYFVVIKKIDSIKILPSLWRPGVAAFVMGLVVLWLRSTTLAPLIIFIAATVVYAIILVLLKEPTIKEIKLALQSAS